jgi:hypothetical protein
MKNSFYEKLKSVFDKFPTYHEEMLCEFNANVGKEDIFKPTTENECIYKISIDNGVRLVNFTTSKNPTIRSIMFPYCNFHKYT